MGLSVHPLLRPAAPPSAPNVSLAAIAAAAKAAGGSQLPKLSEGPKAASTHKWLPPLSGHQSPTSTPPPPYGSMPPLRHAGPYPPPHDKPPRGVAPEISKSSSKSPSSAPPKSSSHPTSSPIGPGGSPHSATSSPSHSSPSVTAAARPMPSSTTPSYPPQYADPYMRHPAYPPYPPRGPPSRHPPPLHSGIYGGQHMPPHPSSYHQPPPHHLYRPTHPFMKGYPHGVEALRYPGDGSPRHLSPHQSPLRSSPSGEERGHRKESQPGEFSSGLLSYFSSQREGDEE